MSVQLQTDDPLLELAEVVLRDADFTLRYARSDEQEPILLAENSDAVAAVGAFVSVENLVAAEGRVSRALSRHLAGANASSKRWDGYVVLLTSARPEANYSEELSLLTQNLRHVRRIVRVGVHPTRAGLARALRPLLPLSNATGAALIREPLDAVTEALKRDGFARSEIEVAIEAFRLGRAERARMAQFEDLGVESDEH